MLCIDALHNTAYFINLKQQMALFDMSRFQHQKSCFSLCQIGLRSGNVM